MAETTKFLLSEDAIPTHWVNLLPDLPGEPLPPLNPQTMAPAGPPDLTPIFPMELIGQEVSGEPEIEIPDAVREVYRLWRPTPLFRARRLEQALGTPAHIYYKYEGVSPAGSHKPNTAVPQAYANAQAGVKKLTTETGAGQWGSSLAFACSLFGMECEVFMVGSSYDQKPYRRSMMQTWGATVHRSPSDLTQSGSANAEHRRPARWASRSPRPSRSPRRTRTQLRARLGAQPRPAAPDDHRPGDDRPDGDGRRGARRHHRLRRRRLELRRADVPLDAAQAAQRGSGPRFLAVEPAACPTLTKGVYAYDFGDTAGLTPLMPMYTLGHGFVPPPVHAGGLRYHGDAPMVCALLKAGLIEARAYRQNETFEAALQFARHEGIIPAPEPAHAIRGAIEEALAAKEAGEERVILFGLCGHGNFDLAAYDAYLAGTLEDPEFSQDDMDAAVAALPGGRARGRLTARRASAEPAASDAQAARCCTPTSQRGAGVLPQLASRA